MQEYLKNMKNNTTENTVEDDTIEVISNKSNTAEAVREEKTDEISIDAQNYNKRAKIVGLIKDLKLQDYTGHQKPIRECLKPSYGVLYSEKGVKLEGESVYLDPKFSHRKKRDEVDTAFTNSIMDKSLM